MANAIKWEAAWTSRSTVLGSGLDNLGSGSYSAAGSEIDNSTNLDQYGKLVVSLTSLTPTSGGYVQIHMLTAPDGTNYEDAPGATNGAVHNVVAVIPLGTATAAKRVMSGVFPLQPAKTKFVLLNQAGVSLSTGNTVTLYTANDEIQ